MAARTPAARPSAQRPRAHAFYRCAARGGKLRALFSIGDTIGDYEIVANLRSGGMATLFLGRRRGAEGFSRHVAIKVVHEHLANDPMFVRMFVDEALLSAKIQHPNVVHVEELRELEGRHFLVMEYVHGCALSTLLGELRKRARTLGPELATYVAVQLAEGLHAAHETRSADGELLGVVHRDVTPQNVLLAYRGHVKLIDFGVAKARGRAQQTNGGSLKGKIGYMSPEQAFGRPVDRRTDVYALGVVLWEMLTGARAFTADNDFALLERVRDPKLPPPSTLNPAVPPVLDAVIARATAREAEGRFETAQQMRKALAQAMPSALALDASDLERLLSATLRREMESDRRALPESVSGLVSTAVAVKVEEADEIMATLTVSAGDIAMFEERASGATPPPASLPTSPTGTVILPDEGPPAPRNESGAGRAPWVAIGLVALLVVALGGGIAAWLASSAPDEMRAIELPRAAPSEVSIQAAPVEAPAEPAEAAPEESPPEPAPAQTAPEAPPEQARAPEAPQVEESPPEPPHRAARRGRRAGAARHSSPRGAVPLADEF